MITLKVHLIEHSRPIDPKNPSQKGSEVWTDIKNGAIDRAKFLGVDINVLHPIEEYHDLKKFCDLISYSVDEGPDTIILPLTPETEVENRLLKTLSSFNGRIVVVNVPPNRIAFDLLSDKMIGYVGMNEPRAGIRAVTELITRMGIPKKLVIVSDKKHHYGYGLRENGVRKVANIYGIPVTSLCFPEKVPEAIELDCADFSSVGVITMGARSTEIALNAIDRQIILGMVGIDLNSVVSDAIRKSRMLCTLIQHPYDEGARAVELAVNPPKEYTEIFCGPTVVDRDNLSVFA